MDLTQPQHWPELKALAVDIDTMDYFEVLNVPLEATSPQIRKAYYSLTRTLHPDRFFHLEDEPTKAAVHKIFKRVVEAYMVLKDETKRGKYRADVTGPMRQARLRFDEAAQAEQREQQKAAVKVAKTPRGEQLYQAALLEMQRGQWDKALKSLQAAAMFEPGNGELKRLVDEVDRRRRSG